MAKNAGPCVQLTNSKGRNDFLPDLQIEQISIANLKHAKHPVRRVSNRQIAKVKRSIRESGFLVPILLGADDEILDGHTRVEAARRLGMSSVPCVRISHLDCRAQRALRIALNKTQETGEWDEQALSSELAYQLEFGADLTVLGFEPPEIDSVLEIGPAARDEGDPIDEIGALPETTSSAVTQPGDVWRLGDHIIWCGNAKEIETTLHLFGDSCANLVFSDPPFNVRVNGHIRSKTGSFEEFAEASGNMSPEEFTDFLARFMAAAKAVTEPGTLVYSFMDWRHMGEMLAAITAAGLELINLCVWVKPNGGMGSFYRSRHELVFVARHPGASHMNNVALGSHGRYRTNVWEYAGATGGRADEADDFSVHPTVKPVRLVEDAILDATVAGATVFDPFLGSGTTILAAERTQRRCVGIEISPAYVDVAIRRWEALTGLEAIHEASDQTFAVRAEHLTRDNHAKVTDDGPSQNSAESTPTPNVADGWEDF
ncbi:DNA modification methylase [Salinihabitans flavidus]|uniref:Methyltransferase n=2 Tax=Salinihabitans flavidus TaxID=569882 RepID=A0A1H8W6D0_9RHOB|nr:DNA modification methylase [Salinihabitans flavidus]